MGLILTSKRAIITGGGSGIGRETARLFASEGAKVAIFDLDQEGGVETLRQILVTGGSAIFSHTDMTSSPQVSASVQKTVAEFGGIEILVNVVGGSGRSWGDGPTADCSEEGWDRTVDLNLKSTFLGCKYAIPIMQVAGGGSIVNISSVLALVGGDADFATHAYAASKGGIISLTRAIAMYYAASSIRANVICPGLIATPMSERTQSDPVIRARLKELQPLSGDFGHPIDVARAALYLASDQASFVTGAVLTVDGGWTVH